MVYNFVKRGILFILLLMSSPKGSLEAKAYPTGGSSQSLKDSSDNPLIRHITVYKEKGFFGGWPANNGIWIWGDEILVGFVKAKHKYVEKGHTYEEETSRGLYARSKDSGETWQVEDPFNKGQTAATYNNVLGARAKSPVKIMKPIDFYSPGLALTFLRETNDTGPSFFYYSYNKGADWNGAYSLPDLGTPGIAARTDYIVNGKSSAFAFVTVAKKNGKEGRVACIETNDGGRSWKMKSFLGEKEPDRFEIMSSSVRLSPLKIISVVRKRTVEGIDLLVTYSSQDNGVTWKLLDKALAYTGSGGSPPALIKMKDERLCLVYIKRSNNGSKVIARYSADEALTWSEEFVLRENDAANWDVGYPRLVQRPDGKLVAVYYWNHAGNGGSQIYRYIAATIFDIDVLMPNSIK